MKFDKRNIDGQWEQRNRLFLSAYWVFTGSSYCFLTLCRLHIGTFRHSLTHLAFVIQECVIASSFFAHMFGIHQLKPCCVPHLPALLVAKSLVIRHEVFIETQRPTGTCNYTSKKLCTRVVSAESRVKTLCHPLFDGNAFLELGMPPGLRSFFFPLPQFIYLRYRKFNSGNNLQQEVN